MEDTTKTSTFTTEQMFDSIGEAYDRAFADRTEHDKSINWILSGLPSSALVLDIGCGPGYVTSRLSSAGHNALGIDISGVMIGTASKRAPEARFIKADFLNDSELALDEQSFDGVTMYFALISCASREDIARGIRKIYSLLKPGGLFAYASVAIAGDLIETEFLGRGGSFSSFDGHETINMIRETGFEIEDSHQTVFQPKWVEGIECKPEQIAAEPHVYVHARKPNGIK